MAISITVTPQVYNCLLVDLFAGEHIVGTHTFKAVLLNSATTAVDDAYADFSGELSTGGGYTNGGMAVTLSIAEASGVTELTLAEFELAASGADIGPFRYIAIINDTTTGKPPIAWYDFGDTVTIPDGESLIIPEQVIARFSAA